MIDSSLYCMPLQSIVLNLRIEKILHKQFYTNLFDYH